MIRAKLMVKKNLFRLRRIVPVSTYLAKPICSWPGFLGMIHDIAVPRGVRANSVPSPLGAANINIVLALLKRTETVPGQLAECGVFRGATIVPTAIYLREAGIDKHILGFDSFQGFDSSVNKDIALGGARDDQRKVGGFSETSKTLVEKKLSLFGVQNWVTLVPGYFRDTLAKYAECRFSFVHLDCDTYESYCECLSFFYPRITAGGIILFDEYDDPSWPGCNIAVDEFLADKPEKPQLIMQDNHQKFYIERLPYASYGFS